VPHPALRAGSWFPALPADMQAALARIAVPRRLGEGERLFARGDAPDGLYCVAEGAVRIGAVTAQGKESLLAIVEPPQWFGEIALFDGLARTHDAAAEGAALLLHLPQAPLLALLDAHPAWWRACGLLLTQKLRTSFLVMEESASLPAAGRLARRLVIIAEGYGEYKDRSRRLLAVPQEQLALMLALSRQTVNQILKQFEAEGAIALPRGGIEILDIAKLRGMAK
jgi:CRP-like cAMP-binding protein